MATVKAKKRKRKAAIDLLHIAAPLRPLAVRISDVVKDHANARTHPVANIDAIKGSLTVYGQRKPVVVNSRTGIVEAGNGTVEAAEALGWTHLAVVYVDDDPATAAGFAIADNRTAELAEWDDEALEGLLADLVTGNEALDAMLVDLAKQEHVGQAEVVEDEAPEPPKVATSKPGQLWLLGDHRLLCGDSTKAEDVARVMGGERAGLCFTSPPYAQQRDYGEKAKEKCQDWDGLMQGVFGNLPMTDAGQVLVNLGLVHRDGEWWPYWDGWIEWMRGQGWKRFGWYVWDQGAGMPGDWGGRFAPAHEFVWHFNRDSVKPAKTQACKHAGEIPKRTMRNKDGTLDGFTNAGHAVQPTKISDSVVRVTRLHGGGDAHPAAFPVQLAAVFMEAWPGIAYEPFAGSGSQFIAAHQLNRRCYGIEIEPRYIDVIIERWEKASGQKARLG